MWAMIRAFKKIGLFRCVTALVLSDAVILCPALIRCLTAHASVRFIITESDSADVPLLVPNKAIEQKLFTGRSDVYRVVLDSGQYLRVIVDPWGIDVGVALYGPDNRKLNEFICPQSEPTPVSLIAELSGAYRLELRALDKPPAQGRYRVRIEEIRPAKARDKSRNSAEKAFAEARQLRAGWSAKYNREAIKKYEGALLYWRAAGDRREEANTLRNIGELYHLLGEPQKALKYYDQALLLSQNVNDRRGEGETLNQIGGVYLKLGKYPQALDYCTKALTLSRATRDGRGEGQALNNIGDAHSFLGDMSQALGFYNQALTLSCDLGDRRGQAQTLMNFGYSYRNLGNMEGALDSYKRALDLWDALSDRRGQAYALTALGHHWAALGKNQEALHLYSQARHFIQGMGEHSLEASVLNGLGYVHFRLDEKQKALGYYRQALQLYQTVSYRRAEGSSLRQIGTVYKALGDSEKALSHFQRALLVFQALADPKYQSYALAEIGKIYHSLGNQQKALDYYSQALHLNRVCGDRRQEAYTLNSIGQIYYGAHEGQSALEYYTQALTLNRVTGDRFGESLTLYNMARVERDRGNLTEARSQIEAALKIVESLRTDVASQDLRSSYFASVREHYDFRIDLLMQTHKQHPTEGLDAAALEASEQARARSLLESLGEARADIRQGVDPDLLERERSLQRSLTAKTDRQMRLLSGKPNEGEATAITKEINDLTTQFDEVQALIRSKSPRYAALTQPQPLSLGEIQQQVLDENTVLLEYALGDERSYLWAVTQTDITSFELPKRAEIEKAARHVYELLIAHQPKPEETAKQHSMRVKDAETQYWQQAATLSQMLLGPAAAKLASKRLLIVTEGALQYLPFGALPVPQVNPTEPRPLIVEHEIVSLPSASALAVLRREILQRKVPIKAAAVLADPVFEADDPRLLRAQATGKRPTPGNRSKSAGRSKSSPSDLHRALRDVGILRDGLAIPRLLFTSREADAIMEVIPQGEGLKAIGFKASRETATSPDLGQYRVVHFATHGLLNSEHPGLSGIVLSMVDEQGQPQNGFLGLRDIYNLNLPVDLVVLSACSTGLGKDVKGEGLVGIVRGFMYAGAARVVASLWKVDDEATAALMKLFYKQMFQGGLAPAAALRAAQIEMWQQKQWRSPYYWSAFVLQGEWK